MFDSAEKRFGVVGGRRPVVMTLGLLASLVGLMLAAALPAAAADTWWNQAWRQRVPITVSSNVAAQDQTVETAIDFATLPGIVRAESFDPSSLRVVEVAADGQVIDAAVPFQFDPAAPNSTGGTLVWQLTGATAAGAARHYQVYFDSKGAATSLAAPTAPDALTITSITDDGFAAYQITTPRATYVYHKLGGGFASLVGNSGLDWINWSPANGEAGDFRGIPNMVHPANGGYFHPGRTTSTTKLISQGTNKIVLESTSNDGEWKVRWEIFANFARMTVLKAPKNYWFLYEGTPGGALEKTDFVMRASGERTGGFAKWARDLAGEEWAYVADPNANQSIFLLHHTQDSVIDSYTASNKRKMAIFGFGRSGNRRYQSEVGDQFSFGLVNSTDYDDVAQAVQTALNTASVTVGAVEQP